MNRTVEKTPDEKRVEDRAMVSDEEKRTALFMDHLEVDRLYIENRYQKRSRDKAHDSIDVGVGAYPPFFSSLVSASSSALFAFFAHEVLPMLLHTTDVVRIV